MERRCCCRRLLNSLLRFIMAIFTSKRHTMLPVYNYFSSEQKILRFASIFHVSWYFPECNSVSTEEILVVNGKVGQYDDFAVTYPYSENISHKLLAALFYWYHTLAPFITTKVVFGIFFYTLLWSIKTISETRIRI